MEGMIDYLIRNGDFGDASLFSHLVIRPDSAHW
jgi:hypothetical protein